MKYPTRQWFLETRGWKPIAVAVAAVVITVGLIFGAQRAEAMMHTPEDGAQFSSMYKDGAFSHARKNIPYSRAFKRAYRHAYMKTWNRVHSGRIDCTDLPGGCASVSLEGWQGFNQRDRCAANVGNDFSSVACQLTDQERYNIMHLVDSPYWQRRGELQNKWTIRVLWCGGIGLATFWTGGTAAAAIGPGASACVGGFFVR